MKMSAQILDGKSVSTLIRQSLVPRVAAMLEKGIVPCLGIVVSETDPSSQAYVAMKRSWAKKLGMNSVEFSVGQDTTTDEVLAGIIRMRDDHGVHGILVQHPLPPQIDEQKILWTLGAAKDADGMTPQSLGLLASDLPAFRAATPYGIIKLLEHYQIPMEGKRAVVIGRSVILGKPVALLLLQKNATVTIAHSRTQDLPGICRDADILVAAVGRPELVKGDWIKPGAVVIDAGYNRVPGRDKDVGDVDFEGASERACWITPVPGGVGPMTVATLLCNVVEAAEKSLT